MDFDPSTAEPVGAAVAEPEFDPTTAKPVDDKKAAAVSTDDGIDNDPFAAGPRSSFEPDRSLLEAVPETKFRTIPGHQIQGAMADVGIEAIKGFATPKNLAITAALGGLGKAAQGTGAMATAAKTAFGLASAYFAGEGIKGTNEATKHALDVTSDPNASTSDVIKAWMDIATPAATAVAGAVGVGEAPKLGAKPAAATDVSPQTKAREELNTQLADQTVTIKAQRPDGSVVDLEVPASHVAELYKQTEEAPKPTEAKPAEKPFDPATAKPLAEEEPFVAETAKALSPEPEPQIQVTIQRPQPHPETGQEIPGYVQFDELANEGRGEPMTPEQRAKYPTPEEVLATDLPTGQHTLEKVKAALEAKNEPLEVTSTKNAQVEREREARGLDAAEQSVVQSFPEVKEQVDKIIADDPQAGEKLVTELQSNRRAATAVENGLLLHRQVQLQNEFRETPLSNRTEIDRLAEELLAVYDTIHEAGTETSRGLNARKMAVAEDFSLANLVTLRRAAKGTKLSPEELQQTADLHRKIEDLQKQFDDLKAQKAEPPTAKRSRIVQTLSDRADAARERLKARIQSGQVSSGIDPAILRDYAEIAAYHLARGVEAGAELLKEFGESIKEHIPAILEQAKGLRAEAESEKMTAAKLAAYKKRTFNRAMEIENKTAIGDFEKTPRKELVKDEEARRLQAKLESAKAEFAAALERDRYEKLSAVGKLKEQGLNTYDAARNLMTTGEFSFILRQGKMTALSHPILTAKAIPDTVRALFSDEVGARAIDLQTMNKPEAAAARAAKLHLVEEGAKLSRQEEIFASKWAEKIPGLRNFNQAGRVFLNKVRFDVWKLLRDQLPEITPERDAQLAKFVNEATGRGTLGGAEGAAVTLGRVMFSPRFLASRIQLLVGHSLWGGDAATRRIIAKEYAKSLAALGVYYTLLAQMKDKNGKPATIEKDPRSSDFGKVKVGNTRLDPLAGLAQLITFGARTATLERKDAKGKITSLQSPAFGQQKWSDVAANFARSKLHPVPGAVINLFNGTDLGGNPATIQNQALNMVAPLTYMDVYQALKEQDMPEAEIMSLLTLLGEGLQTYDSNRKRQKPPAPHKN